MRNRYVFLLCLVVRIFNAFSLKTFFQPDEFYQSLEAAHELVFGYGFLTWEYTNAIRSIFHPLVFAVPFKFLKVFELDSSCAILATPKVIGGIQAAVADYFTIKFIQKYWKGTGQLGIIITLCSVWNFHVATRSFSNSLETSLTAYALYKWPFDMIEPLVNDDLFYTYLETTIKSLSAIGFAFLIRPTTALLWILPAIEQLLRFKTTFLFEAVFVAYVALQYSVILDSFYYGRITFPLLKFLRFNTSGSASFYGLNDWHYYLSQGLPMLLSAYIPFTLHGMSSRHHFKNPFLSIVALVVASYSLLGHKEVRFIMPILPILHGYTTSSFSRLVRGKTLRPVRYLLALLAIGLNLVIATYVSQFHQRGVMDLTTHIRDHVEINEVTLLMPCHSTPWQSHIHRPGNFRFLTCEPPIGLSRPEVSQYRDEADRFYDDPDQFMSLDQQENGVPEYVATFEASQAALENYWHIHNQAYQIEKRWFNSHFHDDHRRRGDVLLFKLV